MNENLSAAERIIQMLLQYTDHMVHNRPGLVVLAPHQPTKVQWSPAVYKLEGGQKVVYKLEKAGKKNRRVRVGILQADDGVSDGRGGKIGEYRQPGLFPEVAVWMYRQVAEVWKLDNEFAAKWASYAFKQEHKDLKVVLAAFMLVQSRKGEPVMENGTKLFNDEDFRAVGEAMLLLTKHEVKLADPKQDPTFDLKLLMRVYYLLERPEIAAINRELGFYRSIREPFFGRWHLAATEYLRYREQNPKMLAGLVKGGWRSTLKTLARITGYKPTTPAFFEVLRWKQKQASDGRRSQVIGVAYEAKDSWTGLTEEQICERVVKERPNFKVLVGKLPQGTGLTRAITAAAIEAGSMSAKDLVILTPTLEDLGLLQVPEVKAKWEQAVKSAEDMRALNIAKNVTSQEVKDQLQAGAEAVVQKKVEEAMPNMLIWVLVDISGSMEGSIEHAKVLLKKFVHAFPLEKMLIVVFNQVGRTVTLKHASEAGVEAAFRGIGAGGGTDYGSAYLWAAAARPPTADEDLLVVWVGDEEHMGAREVPFDAHVRGSGLLPKAFSLIKVGGTEQSRAVRLTAANLGLPCFQIQDETFEDPYAIPRTIRALVASTPVGRPQGFPTKSRVSLVDTILKTDLLKKPAWAA